MVSTLRFPLLHNWDNSVSSHKKREKTWFGHPHPPYHRLNLDPVCLNNRLFATRPFALLSRLSYRTQIPSGFPFDLQQVPYKGHPVFCGDVRRLCLLQVARKRKTCLQGKLLRKSCDLDFVTFIFQVKSYCILLVSFVLITISIVGGSVFYDPYHKYNAVESAMYAALHRPAFAVGSVGVLYVASFGHARPIYKILTWSPWIPLSKLVYGAYLIHMNFQLRAAAKFMNPRQISYFDVVRRTNCFTSTG